MSFSRPLIALASVGVLGLAAVGVGAGATFTQDVQASQTITAGTIDVVVTAPGTDCLTVGDHCHALTLPAVGPVRSTFETAPIEVTMTNVGTVPATFALNGIQMSETHGSAPASYYFLHQMNICIQGKDASGGPWTEANGPLATAVALHPTVLENPVHLATNQSASFWMTFYAGQDSSLCNEVASDGSNTDANWVAYQGYDYATPPSLTSAAMGGVVTPTLTYSFTG